MSSSTAARIPRGAAGCEVSERRPTRPSSVTRSIAIGGYVDGAAHVPRRRQRARGRTHRLHRSRRTATCRGRSSPTASTTKAQDRSASRRASGVRSRPACSSTSRSTRSCSTCCSSPAPAFPMSRRAVRACSSPTISAASARRSRACGSATACRSSPAACRSIAAARSSARVGVSGDGVDQDDMIAFLGLHNAGQSLGGAIGNAPRGPSRRHADRRRACGCATCSARRHRSSTAPKTTCARGSDMKDNAQTRMTRLLWSCLTTAAPTRRRNLLPGRHRPHRQASSTRATPKCRVPTEGAQPGADSGRPTPNAQPHAEDTGRAPRRRVIERAPPAYVSPIPRPGSGRLRRLRAGARSLAHRRHARLQGALVRSVQPQRAEGRPAGARRRLVLQSRRHLRHASTSCARCRRRSARISTDRPGGIDVFGSADQWAAVAEPRGRVRLLQGRHGLQAARLRVPLHAGLQLQLRRARRSCRA